MKKIRILKYLFVLITFVFLSNCSNENDVLNLGTLKVQLQLKDGLTNIPLENIAVKIVNTTDNLEQQLRSNTSGVAIFKNLPFGAYNISVVQAGDTYTLSGTKDNVIITDIAETSQIVTINAVNPSGKLVIKEVYTVGADDNQVSWFKDQFIEIFNNSSETLYADGIYIANLYGQTGVAGSNTPISSVLPIEQYVYANVIDQIPGSGQDYPIAPGKSIVIAFNAINFKEGNANADKALNNTDATLERYSVEWLQTQGRNGNTFFDTNNPAVPNMNNIYIFNETNMYLMNTYGAGMALIEKGVTFSNSEIVDYPVPGSTSGSVFKLMRIPVDKVIDGVDILENSQASAYKRFPNSIDAGFTYVNADGGAFYSGKSSVRIIDQEATKRFGRTILQDTNNSTVDFRTANFPEKYGYN